jgi:hypothetical protein
MPVIAPLKAQKFLYSESYPIQFIASLYNSHSLLQNCFSDAFATVWGAAKFYTHLQNISIQETIREPLNGVS